MKTYNKQLMGLEPNTFPKHKRWQLEGLDYLEGVYDEQGNERQRGLTESELLFLSRFNDEFHGGAVKKNDPNAIHSTEENRTDCYSRNNAANRDLYAHLSANKYLVYMADEKQFYI